MVRVDTNYGLIIEIFIVFLLRVTKVCIRTFLQALCLYFHYDEWNIATAAIKDHRNYYG